MDTEATFVEKIRDSTLFSPHFSMKNTRHKIRSKASKRFIFVTKIRKWIQNADLHHTFQNLPMSMFRNVAPAQLFIDDSQIPYETTFVFRKRLRKKKIEKANVKGKVIDLKVCFSQTQTVWVFMVTEATFVEKNSAIVCVSKLRLNSTSLLAPFVKM